jgi:hypothetical protein
MTPLVFLHLFQDCVRERQAEIDDEGEGLEAPQQFLFDGPCGPPSAAWAGGGQRVSSAGDSLFVRRAAISTAYYTHTRARQRRSGLEPGIGCSTRLHISQGRKWNRSQSVGQRLWPACHPQT